MSVVDSQRSLLFSWHDVFGVHNRAEITTTDVLYLFTAGQSSSVLGPQPRFFRDKVIKLRLVCPHNGTAAPKGLSGLPLNQLPAATWYLYDVHCKTFFE